MFAFLAGKSRALLGDRKANVAMMSGLSLESMLVATVAGITIYTIFVDLGDTQGNSTVLQNCAISSSKYFDLTTSGAIITTFNSIAQQITNLRVSQ